jgi:hypothetical protein
VLVERKTFTNFGTASCHWDRGLHNQGRGSGFRPMFVPYSLNVGEAFSELLTAVRDRGLGGASTSHELLQVPHDLLRALPVHSVARIRVRP